MKIRVAVLALTLVAAVPFRASAQVKLAVQKVAEGVWAAQTEQGSNLGWVLLGDSVLAVDSGSDAATAKAVLEKIAETAGRPVRYLVITHAHGDHAGGAATFAAAGAEVICHENAAGALAALLARSAFRSSPALLGFSERMVLLGGTRRPAIYWLGPGHTAGDVIVFLPEEKVLFTGDLVLNGRLPYMQSADMDPRGWEQIIRRLAALDVEKIVPGHGGIGPRQGIADTLAYVRKVNQLATQFIETRVPDEAYPFKLRDPDNRIENVAVTDEHIANVRAVVRYEKARLGKMTASPTPAPAETPSGRKKPS